MRRPLGVSWLLFRYAVGAFATAVALALGGPSLMKSALMLGGRGGASVIPAIIHIALCVTAAHGLYERQPHGWIAATATTLVAVGLRLAALFGVAHTSTPDAADVSVAEGSILSSLVDVGFAIYLLAPAPLEWCGLHPERRIRPFFAGLGIALVLLAAIFVGLRY